MKVCKITFFLILLLGLMSFVFLNPTFTFPVYAATSPTLGNVDSYSVLGFTTVTCTNSATVQGNVGVSTGTAITGFPNCVAGPPGTTHSNDTSAINAQTANLSIYGELDQGCDVTYVGDKDLVDLSLVAGVYCADTFALSGTLTLSGSGVWIFKSAATLTTTGTANIVGGDPCNVWWREVSSATLGTGTSLIGNILALQSITLNSGASLNGRALAQNGAVTLDANTITTSTCVATPTPAPTSTPTPSSSSSSSSNSNSSSSSTEGTPAYPLISNSIITPSILESRRVDAGSVFINWGPYSGIDTFNVQYGFENGNWLYSTDVRGFSTTISALPSNQPIWVRVAARNQWMVGVYGEAKLVGGPRLPNAGLAFRENFFSWYLPIGTLGVIKEKSVFQNSLLQTQDASQASLGLPVRLIIPSINVDAGIQHLGVTQEGEMEVPSNTVDVGLFKLGPRPGEKGSAVISGHFDGKNGEAGVFANLNNLKKGDKLYVEDNKGTSIAFVVRESLTYNPGYADDVFSLNDGTHLNLITCDGVWSGAKESYSKRLVVFADLIH